MRKSTSAVNLSSVQADVDNPSPQRILPPPDAAAGTRGDKLCIVMVGLPARGKTFIARRLRQYLRFFHGAKCEVFNVGTYRREMLGSNHMADFFDPDNKTTQVQRQSCRDAAMNDMKAWMSKHAGTGTVAIFDATNSTKAKRDWIVNEVEEIMESRSHIIFIESVCTDMSLIDANIRTAKLTMPDYKGISPDEATADFRERIKMYVRLCLRQHTLLHVWGASKRGFDFCCIRRGRRRDDLTFSGDLVLQCQLPGTNVTTRR